MPRNDDSRTQRKPPAQRPERAEQGSGKGTLISWIILSLVLLCLFWFVHALLSGKFNHLLFRQPGEAATAAGPARGGDVPAICAVQGPERAGVVTPPPLYGEPPEEDSSSAPQPDYDATVLSSYGDIAITRLLPGELFFLGNHLYWTYHMRAAEYYEAAAEQGHDWAQFRLTFLYAEGDGVPRDAGQARYWFRSAAEQGVPGAMCRMGEILAGGEGEPKDTARAAEWFRKAAEQGHTLAQFRLAYLYYTGDGLPLHRKKAAEWFRKAAERDHAVACYNLGLMYLQGDGLPQDRAQALAWFSRAAEQGHPEACYHLGLMYERGDGPAPDAHKAARWLLKAANQGLQEAVEALRRDALRTACADNLRQSDERAEYQALLRRAQDGEADAQHQLGAALENGDFDRQKDEAQAAQWYRKAAEQGHPAAQLRLARMCEDGTGVPQDKAEAAEWYRKAAEQDNAEAQKALARMYHAGDGIPRDMAQAVHWYRKLAERSDDKEAGAALNALGKIYAAGDGLPRDMTLAVNCFREAALREDNEAPALLAHIHAAGDGIPRDMGKALLWQHWALWRGDGHALHELARLHAGGDGLPRHTALAAAWYYRLCEDGSQAAEAVKALQALGVDLADLRKYPDVIHRLLKIGMTAARAELALEAAATVRTARGKARIAALCAALARLVPDPAAELARLQKERRTPPIIMQMAAVTFARVTTVNRESLFTLGRMHDEGDGVPRNLTESLYCYRLAAGRGDSRAQAALRRLLPDIVPAPGTPKAAPPPDGNMAGSLLAEGCALWNGDGVPADRAQAVARFRKAVDYGSAEAARILARCCFFGEGTQESDAESLFYLLMYKWLLGKNRPLPEAEAALKNYCEQVLPREVMEELWQRYNDALAAIRQRVWD